MNKPDRSEAASVDIRAGAAAWQHELARAITSVPELLTAVGLDPRSSQLPEDGQHGFPLRVPRGYARRIRRNDPHDPLLRQVLAVSAEADQTPGFSNDPVGDLASMRSRGLLQKYHGRALLVTTGACAIHCRYCFRRNFPYGEASLTPRYIDTALEEISSDNTIGEVILSGGDPLSLSDDRLADLLERIGRISHVRRIRFHSRQPIALPERVDTGLCAVLSRAPRPLVFVIHCNHANEIDHHVSAALSRIACHTALLLNQSVLLRGVNDSAAALINLSTCLFENGVIPYYLHQLDPVTGAAHFAVADNTARRILREAASQLPGYLVPKLVREIPGDTAKQLV